MTIVLATLVVAYLVGAVPFGYLIAKVVKGVDIRHLGSGNIGATNVGRVLGWPWFFVVFLLDFAKGAGPVWIATWLDGLAGTTGLTKADLGALVGLATIIGHMWPIYLGFRGGKGVATGVGVLCTLAPISTLVAVGAWFVALALFRTISLSSILAALALAITRLVEKGAGAFAADHRAVTWLCLVGALLVIVRHSSNIGRLLRGTEPRLGDRRTRSDSLSAQSLSPDNGGLTK